MKRHLTATNGECTVVRTTRFAPGNASPRRNETMARALGLAATPAFATMALLVAGGGDAAMLCPVPHGMASVGSMTLMYALMGVFHLGPWLRLAGRRAARDH